MKTLKFLLPLLVLLLVACDKGYQLRFTNYYTEDMDTVIIGQNSIVFTNIARQTVTDYKKLKHGTYDISCITHSKKHFNSSITIAKSGGGKRSVQIDGTSSIVILEDN